MAARGAARSDEHREFRRFTGIRCIAFTVVNIGEHHYREFAGGAEGAPIATEMPGAGSMKTQFRHAAGSRLISSRRRQHKYFATQKTYMTSSRRFPPARRQIKHIFLERGP
jgi:hypothetical protein